MANYIKDVSADFWWCNSHQRRATFIQIRNDKVEKHHCDPSLGGIMLPCQCVNLTDIVEFEE